MSNRYTVEVQTPLGPEEIAITRHGNPNAAQQIFAWHGITSGNDFWFWDTFWDEAEVILAGLPGHGPVRRYADGHYRSWTPQHLFDVGEAVVRHHARGVPVTLIGHSTGGLTALGVTLQAPELVARLVLLGAVIWNDLGGIVRVWEEATRWPALAQGLVAASLAPTHLSPAVFKQAMRFYVADSTAFYANPRFHETVEWGFPAYCATSYAAIAETARVLRATDMRPAVEANPPAVPTLVVHGGKDGVVPLEQGKWIAAHIPGAELFVVPGAGHMSFAEREELVNRRVRQWADAHPVGKG